MKNKRQLIVRICTVLVVLILAAVMFVVGRGHTVYIDNKTLTMEDGTEIKAVNKVVVTVGGEQIAKLAKRERGMATCIGQRFSMDLEITREKGDDPVTQHVELTLPYSMDGIVVNVPAWLEGQPQSVWMSEFVSAAPEPAEEDDGVVTDEFEMVGDL